jgi:D-sedoheptulose 7-phosphate isomerase
MADEKRKWDEIAKDGKYTDLRLKLNKKENTKMEKISEEIIKGYFADTKECIDKMLKSNFDKIKKITKVLYEAYKTDKQIIFMGNGGSASVASHAAADFSKGWIEEEQALMRLRSFSLVENVSLLTSWMNDAGQDMMFVGQLKNMVNPGDVVIGVSGSGNSKNVVNAIEYANSIGAQTIGLTGFTGGKMKDAAKICLVVPSDSFKRLEDLHMTLCHLFKAVLMREIRENLK